ncbi:glycosyltransferase family 4 protein [bacterium]|nr:glycosyltransferase family 4 protein [bacterium]
MVNLSGKSLFIVNDFPPILGGQATYFYNLWKNLPSQKIVVLAPKVSGCERFDKKQNFEIIRKRYLFNIPLFGRIFKIILPLFFSLILIQKRKINIIHCGHVLSTGIIGLILKFMVKKPYIVYTFAADILEFQKYKLIDKLMSIVLKNAYKIISISDFTKTKLIERGIKPKKIAKILPCVNLDKFNPDISPEGIIKKYGLQDKKVILTIARLVKRKGHDFVIKAFPKVLVKAPNAVYLIVGGGPYLNELKKIIRKLRLENKVILTGEATDKEIAKYYNACDVFIMANREIKERGDVEGFGIVFLEASACGKPVIGGRSGGAVEAIVDGETGFLINPENSLEIANNLINLLTNAEYARVLGEKGRLRIEREFTCRKNADALKEFV